MKKWYLNKLNYSFLIHKNIFETIQVKIGKNYLDENLAKTFVKLGYLKEIKENNQSENQTVQKIEDEQKIKPIDYSKLTKSQVIDLLKEKGLDESELKNKTKKELINLLENQ